MNTKDFIQLLTNKMNNEWTNTDDYIVYLTLRNELLEIEMEEKRLGIEINIMTSEQISLLDNDRICDEITGPYSTIDDLNDE